MEPVGLIHKGLTLGRSPHIVEPLFPSCKMRKVKLSSEDYNKVRNVQSKMALGEQRV